MWNIINKLKDGFHSFKEQTTCDMIKRCVPEKLKKIIDSKIGEDTFNQVIKILGKDIDIIGIISDITLNYGELKKMDKQKILNLIDKLGEDKILEIIQLVGIKKIAEVVLEFVEDKK